MMMIKDNADRLYPADRCTFRTIEDPNGGYQIHTGTDVTRALFFPGAIGGTGTNVGNNGTFEIPGNNGTGDRPQLGYIGKSGRFVAMTNL